MNSVEDLKYLNEFEAKEYIKLLFDGYILRKKEKRLFEESTVIPELIITTYYACAKNIQFYNIYEQFKNKYIQDETEMKNFKERYLYNENKLEDVHTKEERKGLRLVYDFIQQTQDLNGINMYTISDIHRILYSVTPYPEFGGAYRKDLRFLPNSGIDLTSPWDIVREMNGLRNEIDILVDKGRELRENINPNEIINYVDKCIELKCKLIKIHPFGDGNGRTSRAFTNLLFRLANLPPVYVENKERDKYGEAMQCALGDNNLSKIKGFYYYKICDSIISLDSCFNKNQGQDEKNNETNEVSQKVKKIGDKNK